MKEELKDKHIDNILLLSIDWIGRDNVKTIYEAVKDLETNNAYLHDYIHYLLGAYTDEEFKELSKKYAGKTKPINIRELERKE
jgi:hypothetical protein